MPTKIVNLTQQSVCRKIEETIKQNSDCADSQVFTNPDLQQKLMAYVLKRVHNCYVAIEPGQEATQERMIHAELQCSQLDDLIRQGMDVLRRTVQPHTLRAIDGSYYNTEPSHWFG